MYLLIFAINITFLVKHIFLVDEAFLFSYNKSMDKQIKIYSYNNPYYQLHHCIDDTTLLSETPRVNHAHRHYEVFQLVKGQISIVVGGHQYQVEAGDVVLISRNQFHTLKTSGNVYERRVIEFDPEFFHMNKEMTEQILSPFSEEGALLKAHSFKNNRFNEIFDRLERELGDKNSILSTCVYTLDLLVEIAKTKKRSEMIMGYSHPVVTDLLNYIDEHIEEKLNLEFLEKELYLSRFYLSHLFKKQMGVTIAAYVLEKKILYAERLIEMGISPTEASQRIGYHYPNFYVNYKKILGKSPSATKKRRTI